MDRLFKRAWWLPGPHLQTLWAALIRRKLFLSITNERVELPDGDFLDLAWVGKGSGPIVIVLHGLNGSIHSPYIRGILDTIAKQGWRGVLMHFRGCSGVPNRLARAYHSGDTADLHYIVQTLSQREPHTPLFAIGYSLGGNVLLKWLGENGSCHPLKAAVAISIPFELSKTVARLNTGFSRIYQWRLLRELLSAHQNKFTQIAEPLPFGNIKCFRTLYEFDNAITAPLHGFKNALDYYTQSSSRQYLKLIQTPTLIVHAQNDPFTTLNAIPQQHEVSAAVSLELPESGGHVGFISGKYPWRPIYWLEQKIICYLVSYLD